MATGQTPIYLLPYPLSTDPVDVHGDVFELADRIEDVLVAKAPNDSPIFIGTVDFSGATVVGLPTSEVNTQVLSTNDITAVDTVLLSSFSTVEYTVSIVQDSKVRSCKVFAQSNGSTVDYVEYAVISTGGTISGVLVEFVTSGSNAELKVRVSDASTTNATVKYIREIM